MSTTTPFPSLPPHEQLRAAWEQYLRMNPSRTKPFSGLVDVLLYSGITANDGWSGACQIAVNIAEDWTYWRHRGMRDLVQRTGDHQEFQRLYGFAPDANLQRFIRGKMSEPEVKS